MAFASISMIAQTIVSTTPMNKKAILEEFTGIHCTYCPDGHLRAHDIEVANPGNFFAINVHTGSYATPGAGEPDFRTSFGDAIAGQSGLTGYPAGTINRHLFAGMSQGTGTAQSRGNWAATAATTMGQASYVNIAATASINLSTRVMSVLVEGYFTGSGAPSTMALNVAILQSNVPGPQTGGSSNPAQMLPNGQYNHTNILRHFLTGQWGEAITTTTQSTFFSKTYSYTIPADINGVPMELGNLDVIAYIAEGNQEIVTGNKAVMSFVTPPGVFLIDLEATDMTVLPAMCDASVTPKVLIKNNTTSVVADTFKVEYVYNNGTAVSQVITTPLNGGASVVVTFPAVSLNASANTIGFKVDVDNVNHLVDIATGNNLSATPQFFVVPSTTIGTTYTEDFEGYADFTTEITNAIVSNPTGEPAFTISKAGVTGLTTDLGGYGYSLSSYMVNFYGIDAGKSVELIFHKIDFSANTGYGVMFNYAYAQYAAENDQLQILVSDDCGATWTTVWDKAGNDLKTAAPFGSGNYFPLPNEWATAFIDLSAYNGKAGVMISFKATSDYGNNLYFDNINVYNSTTIGIEAPVNENSVNVYPNPAVDQFNLDLTLAENAAVSYVVINNLGQKVIEANLGNLVEGTQNQVIDISNLAQGIYLVQININGNIVTKKLTVK